MRRRLLNLLTALSVLLCLTVAALWLRSRFFANDWLGFTVGGRMFECWTSPEGFVVRTVGHWPVDLPATWRSVQPHEKFVGFVLTNRSPGYGPNDWAPYDLGSVECGTACVQYEPDGTRPAWDALRDRPFDRYVLSGEMRTYIGNIRRSPPLPVLGIRLQLWLLGALALVLPAGHLAFAAGRRWRRRRHAARGLCPACGYDLTGNTSGVCPECGNQFAPV